MELSATVQTFQFEKIQVRLCVPEQEDVKKAYQAAIAFHENPPFPFWAKLWPSSLALSNFLVENTVLFQNKIVLEIAAGLGLPGIVASANAAQVTLSDYLPEAVNCMAASVRLNDCGNVYCHQLNWNHLPEDLSCDVLLLSDINYDPATFLHLKVLLMRFLEKEVTIILATPQRLIARPFLEHFLPFCVQQQEQSILLNGERTLITIMVLKKK